MNYTQITKKLKLNKKIKKIDCDFCQIAHTVIGGLIVYYIDVRNLRAPCINEQSINCRYQVYIKSGQIKDSQIGLNGDYFLSIIEAQEYIDKHFNILEKH